MARMADLTGQRFGRWTVISFSHKVKKNAYWNCICECGTSKYVHRSQLVHGKSKSCGCLRDELASERAGTHRMTGTSFYLVWKNIRARCENETNNSFKYYGARGIKVCERWHIFENFHEDMWSSWREGMSIERADNDKDYEPSNCSWILKGDQSKNRRSNVIIDTPWGRMTCADAARHIGISAGSFYKRTQLWPQERWFDPGKPDSRRKLIPSAN